MQVSKLRRKISITASSILFPVVSVAVLVLSAQPAAAATDTLCEINGGNYCVGAPSLNDEDPVKETSSGRVLNIIPSHAQPSLMLLQFQADTRRCVGLNVSNGHDVEVKNCDADQSTRWSESSATGGHRFANEYAITHFIPDYLSGHNNGTQMQVKQFQATGGWYQIFN